MPSLQEPYLPHQTEMLDRVLRKNFRQGQIIPITYPLTTAINDQMLGKLQQKAQVLPALVEKGPNA
jgi:hypothetical protein